MDVKKMFDLTGKVAVVTGGSGGIGAELAIALAKYGADVVVVGRRLPPLEETAAKIRAEGRKALAISCDVTSEESVNAMVAEVLKTFPTINILLNAMGLAIREHAEDFDIGHFRQVMDVNVMGTFIPSKAIGNVMIKNGSGKIINLSSVRGQYGLPRDYAAYSTSKGAVDTMTKTLACEWAKFNVQVNALAPTMIETELTKEVLAVPATAQMFRSRIPMGRWGFPEDLAGLCVFFASDASAFVTGQVVYVDGGVTTW
jgi:gluconate 5-dehydrogenase